MAIGSSVILDAPTRALQVRAVGTSFLRWRPWITGPAMLVAWLTFAVAGVRGPQLVLIGVGFALMLSLFVSEAVRGRRKSFTESQLLRSFLWTMTGIAMGCLATGAATSPMVPLLFAPTGVAFAAFGRNRSTWIVCAYFVLLALLLSAVPTGIPFAAVPGVVQRPLLLVSCLVAVALMALGIGTLSDAYVVAGRAVAHAGADLVEGAQERLRAMEALGAKVAHEVKNPLAAVRALVEVAAERVPDELTRERLGVARAEIDRIEIILRDYLSWSKPLGLLVVAKVSVDDLIRDVAAVIAPRADQLGIEVRVAPKHVEIEADARGLKESLLNLVLNALAAMPGGGRLTLSCECDPDAVSMSVADTGAGMDADTLARVGTAFFSTRVDGTGLGVRLARQIAEQHGGSLKFESAVGRGTTARLRLPMNALEGNRG